ncbi:MAG: septum formation initiator family protein [Oscillospiraceae bacterium]|nr:septum formation initiator family protein [Oscillospiraceae bacterium]
MIYYKFWMVQNMQTHSVLLRIVALSVLLYSLWLFTSSMDELRQSESMADEKRSLLSQLQEENIRLQEKLAAIESGAGMEALARERLGLVMPDERVFYFTTGSAGEEQIYPAGEEKEWDWNQAQ